MRSESPTIRALETGEDDGEGAELLLVERMNKWACLVGYGCCVCRG